MMRALFSLWVLIGLVLAPAAARADLAQMSALFEKNFEQLYEPGRCGMNVLRFAILARNEGIDISKSAIVLISHKGGTDIDAVVGFKPRGARDEYSVKRWFHHAVFEYEGHVFDFDFTDRPRVVPKKVWLRQMWFPVSEETFKKQQRDVSPLFSRTYKQFVTEVKDSYVFELTPGLATVEAYGKRHLPAPKPVKMKISDYVRFAP